MGTVDFHFYPRVSISGKGGALDAFMFNSNSNETATLCDSIEKRDTPIGIGVIGAGVLCWILRVIRELTNGRLS